MKREGQLADLIFDIGGILNPPSNHFCELYFSGSPMKGVNNFLLYFQHVPVNNTTVAIGIKTGYTIDRVFIHLIAFSNIPLLKSVFPDIDREIDLGGEIGIPSQCSQFIVPVPEAVPLSYRVKALREPDRIHTFSRNRYEDAPEEITDDGTILTPSTYHGASVSVSNVVNETYQSDPRPMSPVKPGSSTGGLILKSLLTYLIFTK